MLTFTICFRWLRPPFCLCFFTIVIVLLVCTRSFSASHLSGYRLSIIPTWIVYLPQKHEVRNVMHSRWCCFCRNCYFIRQCYAIVILMAKLLLCHSAAHCSSINISCISATLCYNTVPWPT